MRCKLRHVSWLVLVFIRERRAIGCKFTCPAPCGVALSRLIAKALNLGNSWQFIKLWTGKWQFSTSHIADVMRPSWSSRVSHETRHLQPISARLSNISFLSPTQSTTFILTDTDCAINIEQGVAHEKALRLVRFYCQLLFLNKKKFVRNRKKKFCRRMHFLRNCRKFKLP